MNKTAIITGGGGGLGLETARTFSANGYQLAILDLNAPGALPDGVRFHPCDLGDTASLPGRIARIVADLGTVDVLVNNVGVAGPSGALETIDIADWHHAFRVNLDSAFLTSAAVLPLMKAAGAGSIINISSSSVKVALPFRAAYVASKAALEAMTVVIAREAGPYGVRANVVRPGAMDNSRLDDVIGRVAEREGRTADAVEADMLRYISMRSRVSMADVAGMVLYLASAAARHITGQTIAVDAGVEWES